VAQTYHWSLTDINAMRLDDLEALTAANRRNAEEREAKR